MRYYVDSPASVVGGFTTLEKVIYDLVGDIYPNTMVAVTWKLYDMMKDEQTDDEEEEGLI